MNNEMIQYISSFLSTVTILSCFLLKVPQINQIRQTKSTKGIYIQAMVMEIFSFTTVILYNYTSNYSLMTYLEYPIILVQIYVLLFYTLKYKKMLNSVETLVSLTVYTFLVFAFVTGLFPKSLLSYVLPLCTPISGFAKVTYIYGMLKQQNADAVSLTTWYISVSTNLARLFTVYVDSKDVTLMINFVISAALSGGVLATAIYYKKTTGLPAPGTVVLILLSCLRGNLQKSEIHENPPAKEYNQNVVSDSQRRHRERVHRSESFRRRSNVNESGDVQ